MAGKENESNRLFEDEKVIEIEIERLRSFKDHPFKVNDDMNSRPKLPKYARNKNVIVIGGSGSGKTRFYVKPNLMQMLRQF